MNQTGRLRHIVLCAFKNGTSEQQCERIVADFASLREKIAQIVAFEYGTNISPEGLDQGFTHCFTLTFSSAADRDAYLVAPAHLAFVERLKPWLEKVLVVDYRAQG